MLRNILTGIFSCAVAIGMLTGTVGAQGFFVNFEEFAQDSIQGTGITYDMSDVGFTNNNAEIDVRTGFGQEPSRCYGYVCALAAGGASDPTKSAWRATGATSMGVAGQAMTNWAWNSSVTGSGRVQMALMPDNSAIFTNLNGVTGGTWSATNPGQGANTNGGTPSSAVIELTGNTNSVTLFTYDSSGTLLDQEGPTVLNLGTQEYIEVRMTSPGTNEILGEFRTTGTGTVVGSFGPIGAWTPIGDSNGVVTVDAAFAPTYYGAASQTNGSSDEWFFIPEPTSATLLGIGLVMMLMNRRRRSR